MQTSLQTSGGAAEWKPRERYFHELVYPDPNSKMYLDQPGQFRAELHERLTNPLYPIAFVFLIIAFVGQAKSTRTSRMESLVITFIVAATCRLAGLAVINAIVRHPAMVPVAYALPASMIIVSLIALRRAETQRPGRGLAGKAVDRLAIVWAMMRQRFGYGAAERAAS